MISRLRIENYQSHAVTDIEISPTVTVLTGESDQGKTAVLRALRKVMRNTPVGDFFIRWGEKLCRVLVTVNGVNIERVVGAKKTGINIYTVDADAYNNFGTSVPEEVRIALGVADVQVFEKDKIDLNIHTQHEGEFLVGSPGVEALRGRIFARITGSDVVNRAVANTNSNLRTLKQEIERLRSQESTLRTELETLASVESLGVLVTQMEQDILAGSQDIDRLHAVNSVNTALMTVNTDIAQCETYLIAHPELEAQWLTTMPERLSALRTVLKALRTTYETIRLLQRVEQAPLLDIQAVEEQLVLVTRLRSMLSTFQSIENDILRLTPVEEQAQQISMEQVLNAQASLSSLQTMYRELCTVEAEVVSAEQQTVLAETELQGVEEEYTALRRQLGVCPVCERPFEDQEEHSHAR